MPGRSWRAVQPCGDGKPEGPDRPHEKGVGGIEIGKSSRRQPCCCCPVTVQKEQQGIFRCRAGVGWQGSRAAMESPQALMCPLEKGVRGIETSRLCRWLAFAAFFVLIEMKFLYARLIFRSYAPTKWFSGKGKVSVLWEGYRSPPAITNFIISACGGIFEPMSISPKLQKNL